MTTRVYRVRVSSSATDTDVYVIADSAVAAAGAALREFGGLLATVLDPAPPEGDPGAADRAWRARGLCGRGP